MAITPSFLKRPTAILKMPQAIAQGMSATKFLSQLKTQGMGYRKQRFLADWRSVSGQETKKDVFKYVRKDRRPSMASMADVEWEMNQEYMFKVRANFRTSPEEPLQERFVNIPSDRPMSPQEVEAEVFDRWNDWEKYVGEVLDSATVVSGYHRIDELEPEI
jgi:hypothetical protein